MALIESWLANRLAENPGVYAQACGRVYPIWSPEPDAAKNVFPFITFVRVNTQRDYTSGTDPQGNATIGSDGTPVTTFHVHCWGPDYFKLKLLEDAVRLALDGVRGNANGFQIVSCMIQDEHDLPEPIMAGEEMPIFGVEFVVEITHTETVNSN